jgi:Domain of unknown function (DUF3883)
LALTDDIEEQPQHLGELPSRFRLLAALEVAALLSPEGTPIEAARLSYSQHPSEGLYGLADLSVGEDLLVACGLLERRDGRLIPSDGLPALVTLEPDTALEVLLARWVEQTPPSWLVGAVADGSIQPELISSADWRALESTIADPAQRDAFLLALGNRVDPAVLTDLGARGEEHVAELCRAELVAAGRHDLVSDVIRVSAISDALGYDVSAPATDDHLRRIEVKTVGARSRVGINLTRNEASRGIADGTWALVVVRGLDEGEGLIGWCRGADLAPYLPSDAHLRGRWSVVQIAVPHALLKPGLPKGMAS